MGDSEEYQVVINGDVLEGWETEDVVATFATLSGLDIDKSRLLFQGKPRVVKKCEDQKTADTYHKKLTAMGINTSVIAPAGEPEAAEDTQANAEDTPAPAEDTQAIVEDTPASAEDAQAIAEDTPAPAEDTFAIPEDTPAPAEDSLAIAEDPPAAASSPMESLALMPVEGEEQAEGSSPGSPTMICPSCDTLQPQEEQCSSCGVYIEKFQRAALTVNVSSEPVEVEPDPVQTEGMTLKAVGAAGAAALLGALLWMGIAIAFDYELGLVAWLIGGAVGFASAVTGARGTSAGAMCAGMALVAIIGGKFLVYQNLQEDIAAVMEEQGAWAGEEVQAWFEEAQADAELYLELDGSDKALRNFIFERNYSEAYAVSDVTDEDVEVFLEFDAETLEWMATENPSFEQWRLQLASNVVDISTLDLVIDNLGIVDVIFLVLGLTTAYRLGDEGVG